MEIVKDHEHVCYLCGETWENAARASEGLVGASHPEYQTPILPLQQSADTKRLDWLESNGSWINLVLNSHKWRNKSLREAIDAAMKKSHGVLSRHGKFLTLDKPLASGGAEVKK